MRRTIFLLLAAGCSSAPPAPKPRTGPPQREEGVVFTGLPGAGRVVACDARGRLDFGTFTVEHALVDPETARTAEAAQSGPKTSLFRGTLPFPQSRWTLTPFEVTQLVFPAGGGFVARYHLMNHGDEPRSCRLVVRVHGPAGALVPSEKPAQQGSGRLVYDLKIDPGTSQFIHLTTPELGGKVSRELVDEAAAQWEPLLAGRSVGIPDESALVAYYADVAGAALGVKGCAEAALRFHARLVRQEGDALRLFPDVPEEWLYQAIDLAGIPTPHGPLSLKYEGAFGSRNLELGDACKPPGGFLLAVPEGFRLKVDGRDAEARVGILRVPPGGRRVEVSR
jgi:hypothetical protein